MKKKNKKKKYNNDSQKLLIVVLTVAMIIALIGGGTYAWWSWTSNINSAAERTNLNNVIVATPTFTITGKNLAATKLAPISTCYDANYSVATTATAVAKNNTTQAMTATVILKATFTVAHGSLSDTQKSHINWLIRQSDSDDTTYNTTKCGATASDTIKKGTFNGYTAGNDLTASTITFSVPANTTVTKYYQVYLWVDSGYSFQNIGTATASSAVKDPLQDLKIVVTFSTNSKLEQNH